MVRTLWLPTCCGLTGGEVECQWEESMALFSHLIVGENRSYKPHLKGSTARKEPSDKLMLLSRLLIISQRFWHFDCGTTFDTTQAYMQEF